MSKVGLQPKMKPWTQFPSNWILNEGLKPFRWKAGQGGSETAALLVLAIIGHHAEGGIARLSYADICIKAGISRAMVSAGLDILEDRKIIERNASGRGTYRLIDFTPQTGWAKLPAKGLYAGDMVQPFSHFTLRNKNELIAMKLYFLFVAMRDNDSNYAHISYDKIVERTGIERSNIRGGLSVLASIGLLHIETAPSDGNFGSGLHTLYNRYRLIGLASYQHAGTSGRAGNPMPIGE